MTLGSLAGTFALAILAAASGCGASSPSGDVAPGPITVDYARDDPADQDAAFAAFAEAATSAATRTLVLVDTTIEADEVRYTIARHVGSASRSGVRDSLGIAIVSSAGERSYVVPDARVVLVRATPDPTPLVPGAGASRRSASAINVLASGRVVFDSAKALPVRPAAERFRER